MTTSQKELANRFVVITGANTGIGRATAESLAQRGCTVVLAGRSLERTQPVLDAIRSAGGEALFVELNLGELASVRAGAARILDLGRPIDILINNAGLAGQRGLTKDGFELTFGTNHLGHFLLTVLLAKQLKSAARARIVNVASKAHYDATGIDFAALQKPTQSVVGVSEYAVSKLANVLFTSELARRLGPSGVHSYALHPGVVASDIWRRIPWGLRSLAKLFMISNEEGARTSLYCATAPEVADHDGRYYDKCREKKPNPLAGDAELAKQLWEKSVQWVGTDL
jgi:NAD(P)-dependent dehydrogenase (short-subunit alcohol dehydrogenase family)